MGSVDLSWVAVGDIVEVKESADLWWVAEVTAVDNIESPTSIKVSYAR